MTSFVVEEAAVEEVAVAEATVVEAAVEEAVVEEDVRNLFLNSFLVSESHKVFLILLLSVVNSTQQHNHLKMNLCFF